MKIHLPKREHFLCLLRPLLAFVILSVYLLPNTLWSAGFNRALILRFGAFDATQLACISTVVILIALSFLPQVSKYPAGTMIWLLALIYMGVIVTAGLIGRVGVGRILNCSLVLLPLGAGLLAARLCIRVETAAIVLACIAAAQASYAVYDYAHLQNVMVSGATIRAGGTLDQPLRLGAFLTACLPLALWLAFTSKRILSTTVCTLLVTIIVAAIMLTWSRSCVIAAAIALTWMIYRISSRKSWVIGGALVVLLLCFLTFLYRSTGPRNHISLAGSDRGHITGWRTGLETFEQHWLLGVGVGSLHLAIPDRFGNETQNNW